MTNNPLPAAPASIKRYDIDVYGNAHERGGGAWIAAVDVLALPPPADGAVAWEARCFNHLTQQWQPWVSCSQWSFEKHQESPVPNYEYRALYAAPPADSPMVEALQACVDSLAGYRREMNDTQPCDAETRARTLLAGRT